MLALPKTVVRSGTPLLAEEYGAQNKPTPPAGGAGLCTPSFL
jgi:hypothetical protein